MAKAAASTRKASLPEDVATVAEASAARVRKSPTVAESEPVDRGELGVGDVTALPRDPEFNLLCAGVLHPASCRRFGRLESRANQQPYLQPSSCAHNLSTQRSKA